jgi:hypothetical protein
MELIEQFDGCFADKDPFLAYLPEIAITFQYWAKLYCRPQHMVFG